MEVLGDQIEAIRESGIGIGLSDAEIDKCILAALKEMQNTTAKSKGNNNNERTKLAKNGDFQAKAKKKPKKRSCSRKICLCGVYFAIFIFVVSTFVANSEQSQQWLEKQIDPWIYPITKNWRLATLPLARHFDLDMFYNTDCLVPNPLAMEEAAPCEMCEKVTKEHTLVDVSARQYENNYMGKPQPLVIKGTHDLVSFADLKDWYNKNGDVLRRHDMKLKRAPAGLVTIDQFLVNQTELDILTNPDFHLEWITEAVNPSRILRQLFPRQKFIPNQSEVNLHKKLTVLGPIAEPFDLYRDRRAMQNLWYVQASGSRHMLLKPDPKCVDKCPHIRITLEAGDIMCFSTDYWTITSAPVTGNTDINVIFIGSFM